TIFLNHPFPFNPTVTTAIYTLSLHDALPIYLSVTSDLASKQFKITVLPLDRSFEKKLQAADPDHLTEVIPTFPMSAAPHTLDDGDAFSLDLLINQNAGVKIIDVVRVTFDKTHLRDFPKSLPRDFTLDAIEL